MARTMEFGAATTNPLRSLPNRTRPTIDSPSQGLQAHSPLLNQLSNCASFSMTASLRGVTAENTHLQLEDEEREALQNIINNAKLNEGYLTLARDIEVMEAKTPEDIYKIFAIEEMLMTFIHLVAACAASQCQILNLSWSHCFSLYSMILLL